MAGNSVKPSQTSLQHYTMPVFGNFQSNHSHLHTQDRLLYFKLVWFHPIDWRSVWFHPFVWRSICTSRDEWHHVAGRIIHRLSPLQHGIKHSSSTLVSQMWQAWQNILSLDFVSNVGRCVWVGWRKDAGATWHSFCFPNFLMQRERTSSSPNGLERGCSFAQAAGD